MPDRLRRNLRDGAAGTESGAGYIGLWKGTQKVAISRQAARTIGHLPDRPACRDPHLPDEAAPTGRGEDAGSAEGPTTSAAECGRNGQACGHCRRPGGKSTRFEGSRTSSSPTCPAAMHRPMLSPNHARAEAGASVLNCLSAHSHLKSTVERAS